MLGNTILIYRKRLGMTQEQLAQKLEVTNQAVSKWEGDQCCPYVALLPKLADVLGISLDTLFGRTTPEDPKTELPWEDDDDFHVVLYCGHKLVGSAKAGIDCSFSYEGPVRNIYCDMNLECGEVQGNVNAGGYVECDDVAGHVSAGDYVECGDVAGNLSAGNYVECGDVGGSVSAGAYVECGDVGCDAHAGTYVECGDVGCDVHAGIHVEQEDSGIVIDGDDGSVRITIQKEGKEKKGFDPAKFSKDFFKGFWKD